MTPEQAIENALTGEEVWYPVPFGNISTEREKMQKAALKLTGEPIIITTRTDATYQAYLVVRKYDKSESIPYEESEKEAREKGWIK